ncbi:MAG: helix-turn-helix transcriptional regulator [Pseudomonadota bacterium]
MSMNNYYKDFAFGEDEPVVVRLSEALTHTASELVPHGQAGSTEIQKSDAQALGSYISLSVAEDIQFFSCDLQFDTGFETRGTLPAGIWVGALFSGTWATRFGDLELLFRGNGMPHVLSFGESRDYFDRPASRERLRMASFLIGEEFLDQMLSVSPDSPFKALRDLIRPGIHNHPLSDPKPIGDTLFRLVNNPYCGQVARLFVESTILSSIFQLAQIFGAASADASLGPDAARSTLAYEARHLIDLEPENFDSILSLASKLGTNETTLGRQFKAEMGMTVFQYVLKRRMQAARLLVRDGVLQISEIAHRIGYSSPANFTTAYKRFYGTTPAEDRR